jgi:hypothetical protein
MHVTGIAHAHLNTVFDCFSSLNGQTLLAAHAWGVSMKFHDRNVVACREMEGAAMGGDCVIDLAEVRAARGRTAAAGPGGQDNLFRALELQSLKAGTTAELMIADMTRFLGELDGYLENVRVAREFCMACQDACELDDIDAMIEARDRLQADFDARNSGVSRSAVE